MPDLIDDTETPEHDDEHTINVERGTAKGPLPDATSPVPKGDPYRDPRAKNADTPDGRDDGPRNTRTKGTDGDVTKGLESQESLEALTPKERDLLAWVVLLRFASYRQLQHLQGGGRDASLLRRRIGKLIERGFLATWDRPGSKHRGQRYVLPTALTLKQVMAYLRDVTAHEAFAPLLRHMLPAERRRPFSLEDRDVTKWLPHQLEVNELVTRIRLVRPSIAWASTWEAPFPTTIAFLLAPQPDYVLVEGDPGAETIVFGEHDRGTGEIADFIARKISLYDALAHFPYDCTEQFGLSRLRVDVTVIDTKRHEPMQRLRAMIDAASASMHPEVFRFTLGGWLYAYTSENVWFSSARVPVNDSLHWPDHRLPASA
jgi:hypothetical protein